MAFYVNGQEVRLVGGEVGTATLDPDEVGAPSGDRGSFEISGRVTGELRLTERDQAFPAGRYRFLASGDQVILQRAGTATWTQGPAVWSGTPTVIATWANDGGYLVPDDALFRLGTTGDQVFLNRSASLNANTGITNALAGTPVSAATPANSLIISNITANGDIAVFTLLGGTNSTEVFRVDTSAGLVVWNEAAADWDHRWEADGNANLLTLDAGLFGGVGGIAMGGAIQATPTAYVLIDPAALTATANQSFSRLYMRNGAAITVPAGTAPIVASLSLDEPNITATGTVTDAATFYVTGAPTEGTRNWAAGIVGRLGLGALTAVIHDLNTTTAVVFNEQGDDIDFRIESNSNTAAFVLDANLNSGQGAIGFFGAPLADRQIDFEFPAFSSTAAASVARVLMDTPGSVTTSGVVAQVVTVYIGEPNITIGADSVTASALLQLNGTATEATSNYTLWATGANSTTNSWARFENTSNAAAASHSIVDIAVGGTTSTGDPQLRLTVPGGTSWYVGVDNSDSDALHIGTSTTVGSNSSFNISTGGVLTLSTGLVYTGTANLGWTVTSAITDGAGQTVMYVNPTYTVTSPGPNANAQTTFFVEASFNATGGAASFSGTGTSRQSGGRFRVRANSGTVTVDEGWGVVADVLAVTSQTITTGGSFLAPGHTGGGTVTTYYGMYVANSTAGTITNQYGIYIEDQTRGGTLDYGVFIAGADTAAIWVNSADPIHVGLAGTATGKFELSGATSGTVTLTVGATAGTWTMVLPAAVGGAGDQLTDAAGNGITSWAAAASLRQYKDVIGLHSRRDALDAILGTQVFDFRYREGYGTLDYATLYVGPMADDAPWMAHYNGRILNPINSLGYTILAIQALNESIETIEERIERLEKELAALKGAA